MIVYWNRTSIHRNIIHIHGTADKILSHKNVKSTYQIEGGGHAMILFNVTAINQIIENELT